MVAYNITIDDTSPMIQYSPGWVFNHPKGMCKALIPCPSCPLIDLLAEF
jgi:hypothetical protein